MGDYLRNAMEYFGKPSSPTEQEFLGRTVEILASPHSLTSSTRMRLKVKNVIAEGGTAYIYKAQDLHSGKEYALKRFFGAEHEDCVAIKRELNLHKVLPYNNHIVKYFGSTDFENKQTSFGSRSLYEFYLVTELCQGTLYDYINFKQSQSEVPSLLVIAKCFAQCVKAVEFLHRQNLAITHRDIKIENFLIGKDFRLKLCDFGSATTDFFTPSIDWNARQREKLQDQIMKVTTPIYRPPEIIDIWSNYPIGPPLDVWGLGCILYFLCFQKHPFENNSILYITNGNFSIPKDNPALISHSQCFHNFIKECLQVNPDKRIEISHLSTNFEHIARTEGAIIEDLYSGISELSEIIVPEDNTSQASENCSNSNSSAASSSISGFMSQVKGGAEHIFKNIKQNIKIHQQQFQHSQQITDNNRTPIFLTSKIAIIMSPSTSTGTPFFKHFQQDDMDPVRLANLSFYNLSRGNKLVALPPPIRVVEAGTIYNLSNNKCPTLECLQILVDDIFAFLATNPKNMVVVQNDEVNLMGTVLTALLMFSGIVENADDALQICAVKLNFDLRMRSSQIRYLQYLPRIPVPSLSLYVEVIMCKCLSSQKNRFHRLFLELYGKSDQVILSTEADISPNGELAKFPIAMSLNGEVAIVFYHSNGGSKHKVGQLQFNTAFEMKTKSKTSNLFFASKELDDTKNDFNFDVKVSVTIGSQDEKTINNKGSMSKPFLCKRDPDILFSSKEEFCQLMDIFGPRKKQETFESEDKNFVFINNKNHVINNCDSKEGKLLNEVEQTFGNLVDLGEVSVTEPSNILENDVPVMKHPELDDIFGFSENDLNSFPKGDKQENEPSIFQSEFKLIDVANSKTTNVDSNSIINHPEMDKSSSVPTSALTKNLDDILGDFAMPNVKFNGILEPNKTEANLSTTNNVPLIDTEKHNPKASQQQTTSGFSATKGSYNSSYFDFNNVTTNSTPLNNSKAKNDIFADILNEQGYKFSSKTSDTPVSINDLYKKDMIAQMDPEKAMLFEWSKGKENNIRGLLCTLHNVLWSNAKWQKCEMSQVVSPADVKKVYRKACLAVHPDKHNGTEHEHVAKLIFMELNQAWSNFENDSTQQKLFS